MQIMSYMDTIYTVTVPIQTEVITKSKIVHILICMHKHAIKKGFNSCFIFSLDTRDSFLRSGVVAVLLNETQRMNHENGHINIVESVKLIKARNSSVIQNHVSKMILPFNLEHIIEALCINCLFIIDKL